MANSLKLSDSKFWDSSSITHNRQTLNTVLNTGTLVQSWSWSKNSPVAAFQLNNLNLVADGGVYDIVFNFYNQGSWCDLGLWLPEYNVNQYNSMRLFNRSDSSSTGESYVSGYKNFREGRFYLGDMRPNRGCFYITISLLEDGDGKTLKVNSQGVSIDDLGFSTVYMGGYLGTFCTNITQMYFYTLSGAKFSGSINVYRRQNIGIRPVNK